MVRYLTMNGMSVRPEVSKDEGGYWSIGTAVVFFPITPTLQYSSPNKKPGAFGPGFSEVNQSKQN
jgi:hypothetical protein